MWGEYGLQGQKETPFSSCQILCVVELDFFTLTSSIPRLQEQCPCKSVGWTLGWENVRRKVWCEVIRSLSKCLWLHFDRLLPRRQRRGDCDKVKGSR